MRGFILNSVVDYNTLPGQPPLPMCRGTRLRVSDEVSSGLLSIRFPHFHSSPLL
jgi:hypothetical protein